MDLGYAVVDQRVQEEVESAVKVFAGLGAKLEEARPDSAPIYDAFQPIFAAGCTRSTGERLEEWKDQLAPGDSRAEAPPFELAGLYLPLQHYGPAGPIRPLRVGCG